MQQDWKAIWDNLNPDEAAKERMKQAILQKMQAETPQTASKKPPFFLQRCSFGTFARAAALCCMTVTVALAGLHLTDRRTAELLPEPSVSEQPAETTTPHTLPAQTTATLQTQTTTKTQTQTALQTTATAKQTVTSLVMTEQTVASSAAAIEKPESKNRQKNRFRQSQFVPNQNPFSQQQLWKQVQSKHQKPRPPQYSVELKPMVRSLIFSMPVGMACITKPIMQRFRMRT